MIIAIYLWCRSFDESNGGHFETCFFFLGGGFIFLIFTLKIGADSQFDQHIFSDGLVQPPVSFSFEVFVLFFSFITIPGLEAWNFWTPKTKQKYIRRFANLRTLFFFELLIMRYLSGGHFSPLYRIFLSNPITFWGPVGGSFLWQWQIVYKARWRHFLDEAEVTMKHSWIWLHLKNHNLCRMCVVFIPLILSCV